MDRLIVPNFNTRVVVEGSTDGVAWEPVPTLTAANVQEDTRGPLQLFIFTTRWADLSTYVAVRITYDGRIYTVDRFLPIRRKYITFNILEPSVPA